MAAKDARQAVVNTIRSYHSAFFGVGSSESASGFDTVEVRSSSLLAP